MIPSIPITEDASSPGQIRNGIFSLYEREEQAGNSEPRIASEEVEIETPRISLISGSGECLRIQNKPVKSVESVTFFAQFALKVRLAMSAPFN
jgi:hypothetical protein